MTTSKLYDLVAITWDDAHKGEIQSVTAFNLDEIHKPFVLISVGWLLRWDEEGATISPEQADDDESDCRGYTFIPDGMITKVVMLKSGQVVFERKEG